MAVPFLGFVLTYAPIRTVGLGRKNTVVGKCSRKAATSYNERFGEIAEKNKKSLVFSKTLEILKMFLYLCKIINL